MTELVGYERLIVWQKADQLVFVIYKLTTEFPKSEIFSLVSQLRRATLSVPTNIVEGYARNSKAEFRRFLMISLGSLAETKYLLSVASRLNYISASSYKEVVAFTEEVGRLLWSFHRSQKIHSTTVA